MAETAPWAAELRVPLDLAVSGSDLSPGQALAFGPVLPRMETPAVFHALARVLRPLKSRWRRAFEDY